MAAITEQVSCPVLVVPASRRQLPTRLAFRADMAALPLNTLPGLAALAGAFPVPLDLVQLRSPTERPRRRQLRQALSRASAHLSWEATTTNLLEEANPQEALGAFCTRNQTQLLILAPTHPDQLRRYLAVCYGPSSTYPVQLALLVVPAGGIVPTVACCHGCAQRLGLEASPNRAPGYFDVRWV